MFLERKLAVDEECKRAAIHRFCELVRLGLVEHDWSEVAATGVVKVRVKPGAVVVPWLTKH